MTDMYLTYSKVSLLNTVRRLNPRYIFINCSCNTDCTLSSSSQLRPLSSFFLGDTETEIFTTSRFLCTVRVPFVAYAPHVAHAPYVICPICVWHSHTCDMLPYVWHSHTCDMFPYVWHCLTCDMFPYVWHSHTCDMSLITYPHLFTKLAFLGEENKLRPAPRHTFIIDICYFNILGGFILCSFHFVLKICLFPLDSK